MKNRSTYTILFVTVVVGFWLFENFYSPKTYSNPDSNGSTQLIAPRLMPSSNAGDIVQHEFFMLSYSESHEQAAWVAYPLKRSHLTQDDRERPYFIEDPRVKTRSADWRNYKGSGYDRGHLCPAGDRRFSEQAYNETFYTSNISPQNRQFNAGIWNRLEQQVRQWCKRYGDLVIVTGGVLKGSMEEIGEEDVAVPKKFYKIVFREEGDSVAVLAFLIPNKESNTALEQYLVSVDELEEETGINFFEKAPETWQKRIEKQIDTRGWQF